MPTTWNKLAAETVGTFILVFIGCGSVVTNDYSGAALGAVGVGLCFGLVVTAMIYSVGNVSGAHLNPAVTIAFWVSKRLPCRTVTPYIVAQCSGALLAAFALKILFPAHASLGASLPAAEITAPQALVFEVVLSFIFMFVIFNVSTGAKEKGIMAGVAVGATVAVLAIMGGPICGASMNPARSIGPALASGQLQSLWVYLIGPVAGTLLAVPFCKLTQGENCCPIDNKEIDNGQSC